MVERAIADDWVFHVLLNWVARRWDESHQSMNYYGFVGDSSRLLKVAVSRDATEILTAHFDTRATRRYHSNRDFFDEVYDEPTG